MQLAVSVIIPVYNTKEYLTECVDSICAQQYPNIEILLVDDGSTDGSGALCDAYANNAAREGCKIVALHQANAGISAARNNGIAHATGEYLLFLDSDDCYTTPTAVGTLVDYATKAGSDVLCFNYTRSKAHTPERNYAEAFSTDVTQLIANNVYTSSACLKLIRTTLLREHDITFIAGQRSEDILFCGKLLTDGRISIAFLNEVFYFYRVRETSTSHTLKLDHITTMVAILHELIALSGDAEGTHSTKSIATQNILAYTAFQYATLLINIHRSAEKIPADCLAEIYEMKYLLQYNPTGIVRVIALCSKCFGVRFTSHLMALAFRAKEVLHR